MQTLIELSTERTNTIIFPMPIDLSAVLKKLGG